DDEGDDEENGRPWAPGMFHVEHPGGLWSLFATGGLGQALSALPGSSPAAGSALGLGVVPLPPRLLRARGAGPGARRAPGSSRPVERESQRRWTRAASDGRA